MSRIKDIALDGIVRQNPMLVLVLGTCPILGITSSATNSFGMGMAVTFVLIFSNLIISLLRNIIPNRVRIPCFIVIIATFVTIVRMVMQAYFVDLYSSLGIFIPLIVVNCLILGRAESFASSNPIGYSMLDGLFMGLGFTLAMTIMGIIREILAKATVFGVAMPWTFSIAFFGTTAGAFLTYGMLIAGFSAINNAVNNRNRHKLAAATYAVKVTEEVEA